LLELNIIQLVKSYTVGQTAVENMRMVDDHAYSSPIATHLRARKQTLNEEKRTKYVEYCPAVTLRYTEGTSLRGVKNVTQYSVAQSLQSSTAIQRNIR
jgi:hypothetical protein